MKFAQMTVLDLIRITQFLHAVKPSTRDKIVYGVKQPAPDDQSIMFFLMPSESPSIEVGEEETETVILSAQYIVDHPFWISTQPNQEETENAK